VPPLVLDLDTLTPLLGVFGTRGFSMKPIAMCPLFHANLHQQAYKQSKQMNTLMN